MLAKLLTFMTLAISSLEVPMLFRSTLVIRGYGIVYVLVVGLMEDFVTSILTQVQP